MRSIRIYMNGAKLSAMSSIAAPLMPALLRAPADLSATQRGFLAAGVVALHGALAWAAMSWQAPTSELAEPAAISVSLITADAPLPPLQAPSTLPVQPTPQPVPRQPVSKTMPSPLTQAPVAPLLASAQPAQANEMQAPMPAPEARPQPLAQPTVPAVAAPVNVAASAAPEPARPPAAPKTLPSSAVRYLVPPVLNYPRVSRELGEAGTVRVKVLVDEQGRPKEIELLRSSGFPRLDQEAMRAMRGARFQPYVEDGVPRAVWAPAQLTFDLEE